MVIRAVRSVSLALLALGLVSSTRADTGTQAPSHATIRGTGSDIQIVFRGDAPSRARLAPRAPASGSLLADAARLKSGGASDETVIAFLRLHQTELPPVTEVDAVRQLRKAGAGAPVISYLSRLTALDIGETGEGAEPAAATPYAMEPGGYEMANGAGYPLIGVGYGGPFAGGGRSRHVFHPPHRPAFGPGRPGVHGSLAMRSPLDGAKRP